MKIAILGLGNIAQRVALGIKEVKDANLYAVASRDIEKAEAFKEKYGAKMAYGSYEDLLRDQEVELVYICTPNHLHYEQIKQCFEYKKHVICEKPLVSNRSEVEKLFALTKAHGCFLMEAEKTIFTPLNQKLKAMVEAGVIGNLLSIKADYCYNILEENLPENHWAYDRQYGGCSYDVGVYPICFANYFAGADIFDVKAEAATYQDFICDFNMNAHVIYQNGIVASINSSWLYTTLHKGCAYLIGEEGYIEVPSFWKGKEAILVKDGKKEKIVVTMKSDFTGEIEEAVRCIQQGLKESTKLGKHESLEIMKVLDNVNHYRKG